MARHSWAELDKSNQAFDHDRTRSLKAKSAWQGLTSLEDHLITEAEGKEIEQKKEQLRQQRQLRELERHNFIHEITAKAWKSADELRSLIKKNAQNPIEIESCQKPLASTKNHLNYIMVQ